MDTKFNVNLNTLVSNKLTFEGYFILWCLNINDENPLMEYVRNCRKIPTEIFNLLQQQNFITIEKRQLKDNKITFNSLNITQLGRNLFETPDFDVLFEELKQSYPKEVGNKLNKRRLHTDLKRCKVLYKKIINDDIDLHRNICKSAILYHQEKLKTGSEIYMQNLATWLHQENYNQYLEEAKLSNLTLSEEQSNITSI